MSRSPSPPPPPPRHKGVTFVGRRSSEPMHEQSPLLLPRTSQEIYGAAKVVSPLESPGENSSDDAWIEQEADDQKTKSSWYLFLLTLGGLGLQIGWSVETSYGSPYLLSLGVSKSLLALVWIAGPLSGVLVQPYVGMKSDNCRIRWGKRRPFIVGGAAATILSLMILAWVKEIIGGFFGIFGASQDSQWVKDAVLLFAVLFIYVLDFAINVIQAGIRAFIVDCSPTHQQEAANAWMIRMSGIGNILGYLAGNIKLPLYFPFLGSSQFKVLCAIASFIMAVTVAISCATIHERDPNFEARGPEQEEGVRAFFRDMKRAVKSLPRQIRRVCEVQFFAWIGWFPFLFYITTYVGEIYMEPFFEENPNLPDKEIDRLSEEATRIGTRALLIFAVTTFVASVILPFIIPPTYEAPQPERPTTPRTPMTPMAPSTPGSMSGSGYFALPRPSSSYEKKNRLKRGWKGRLNAYLSMLQIRSLTLRRAWLYSHILFAFLMVMTFFVRSTLTATILVAFIGIPWTLTNWAPFALISSEISKRDAIRHGLIRPTTHEGALIAAGEDEASNGPADKAGVVLGIHNVAIAAPQVIATLISSVIFKMLQKERGKPGDDSVAWVLRFGGCCALVAAWWCRRVGDGGDEEVEDAQEDYRERWRRSSI